MQGTIVLPCTCQHDAQDEMYGKGRRLHNISGKAGSELAFCTVCTPRRTSADKTTTTPASPIFGNVAIFAAPAPKGKTIPR